LVVFILKRLAFLVPQLAIVIVGTFLLLRLLPADPAAKVAGLVSTPEAIAQAKRVLGIDKSVSAQLWTYVKGLVHGDLGRSWATGEPVRNEIQAKFPVTLQLIVLAFVLALSIAIPVGCVAAERPGGRVEKFVLGYALFAGAQPDFWWGLFFVFLFAAKLSLFPVPTGIVDATLNLPPPTTHFILIDAPLHGYWDVFSNASWHYCLPVCTLAFVLTGPLIKMTRNSVLHVVGSDYILYARAAGFPARTVRWTMLRNSLAPVVTLTGILFGFMLGGAVLIEYVFTLDGLGRYALNATLNFDYPAVQGAVIVMTAFALFVYLVMDICHALLDPRVRYGER